MNLLQLLGGSGAHLAQASGKYHAGGRKTDLQQEVPLQEHHVIDFYIIYLLKYFTRITLPL